MDQEAQLDLKTEQQIVKQNNDFSQYFGTIHHLNFNDFKESINQMKLLLSNQRQAYIDIKYSQILDPLMELWNIDQTTKQCFIFDSNDSITGYNLHSFQNYIFQTFIHNDFIKALFTFSVLWNGNNKNIQKSYSNIKISINIYF